ncbi:unnamed protein product [Peronospora belbahrii]|uniref:Rhodopsin n=1 Tax=Peronospora belbahrii TaxID=622444 RepID=A0AAU9LCP3_9STRA|nr:unnamed protein product [Peronospora belbahrii]
MDEGCDMLECCLCGALCGACCASAADSGDNRRRKGRHSEDYHNGQTVYVQPVMVEYQPGYSPPLGQPRYALPGQGYGPPPVEYPPYASQQYPPQQYPPQQCPPQQYPPQQYPPQQQYPPKS